MDKVKLKCAECQTEFEKSQKEYRRKVKWGKTDFFCTLNCGAKFSNRLNPRKGNPKSLTNPGNRQDLFSPFRYYVNKARCRERVEWYGESQLTVEYLKRVWEEQKGICPYSKLDMDLPINTRDCNIRATPTRASLDRIDSSKGYLQGNVEFVCMAVNYAKNGFSKEQTQNFFDSIRKSAKL